VPFFLIGLSLAALVLVAGILRNTSRLDRATAIGLALILGGVGIHKFYLGRVGQGVLYLLFC